MRTPSVPLCCSSLAVATVLGALAAPMAPDKAALFTTGVAGLIGVCAAVGRTRLQHAATTLRTIIRDEQQVTSDEPTPWVELTPQHRTVSLQPDGEQVVYPGFTIRSGIGPAVIAQRWLPYSDSSTHADDEQLIACLRAAWRSSVRRPSTEPR
ncbi:MAG TPA: phage holin family protein [Pseudonocardiaceae bacterium]|nr:phage holin family protein [Pseudonocardiaceae bacterium]